ncbi:hypothetical protein NKR23_g11115 [Pleurostoma richardsiae]|uniref:Uncharacterized protein n=1 Tax=Pleurostoma richardsiae TaxID=41990 RepID=A0AA38RB30_9PEZI|nr:hypothetical protein NKR23_g11115 [Pleurostoma richardsiae]
MVDYQGDMALLVNAAFYILIGIKKRMVGVLIERTSMPVSLLDVAPAVFSAHFAEAVTSRIQLLPHISSLLAALTKAQSPSLRRKIGDLLDNSADHAGDQTMGMALSPSPDVYGVISQRLSVLVRSNMLSSPMTKRPEPQATRSGSPRPGSAEDSINVDVAELLGNTGVDGYTQMLEEGYNWETQHPDLFEEFYADSDEDEEMWYDAEMAMDAYDDSYHEPDLARGIVSA